MVPVRVDTRPGTVPAFKDIGRPAANGSIPTVTLRPIGICLSVATYLSQIAKMDAPWWFASMIVAPSWAAG